MWLVAEDAAIFAYLIELSDHLILFGYDKSYRVTGSTRAVHLTGLAAMLDCLSA